MFSLLFLFCCGLNISSAQCPTSDILFDTQTKIDSFSILHPGCTAIPAGVNVKVDDATSNNITTLSGLSNIRSIEGNLVIFSNFALANLNGLDSLSYINGDLSINSNYNILTLNALNQLTKLEVILSLITPF